MIECVGLYGRDLTSDPVQVLCKDGKKVWFKFLDVVIFHALSEKKFFLDANLYILYTIRSVMF